MPLDPRKRRFLVDHLGESSVKELEGKIARLAKQLEREGIGFKELSWDEPPSDPILADLALLFGARELNEEAAKGLAASDDPIAPYAADLLLLSGKVVQNQE